MYSKQLNRTLGVFLFSMALVLLHNAEAQQRLRMATTTSTDNSGLLAKLNPPFEAKYKIKLDVIAVGTGKALRLGENGDVDIVFVHAPGAEKKFVGAGIVRSGYKSCTFSCNAFERGNRRRLRL